MEKNLVVSPTGRYDYCQEKWVLGKRHFDLMLINYSNTSGKNLNKCDYYFEAKGFKFEIIKKAIEANIAVIKKYDFIWFPDDDLEISTRSINTLFRICRRYHLSLAQPSVSNSDVIHFFTRRRLYSVLRYVNFVELMCPLFSREALFKVIDTFAINRSGYGIDWLWAERLKKENIAVVDAVSVYHARKLFSGEFYKKLNSLDVSFDKEGDCLLQRKELKVEYKQYGKVLRSWAKIFNILCPSPTAGILATKLWSFIVEAKRDITKKIFVNRQFK